ncbi:[NiFe]-hydrogenase assembly chaperone HybE [Candidatus Igneacidithiobacillus taiwanensis]|uniref:[NiFe]-hydrogenase assembly chaperone HybE n=1 Tax=Candidatus Igneacidithiobacillus taiwanensis TaxID=1945924 RepID=UPI0028A22476|nr:[NiFe]-hydrogenase assembly chaperone HybE [Candidatus Igneacidithiobacillus taiwanensis]
MSWECRSFADLDDFHQAITAIFSQWQQDCFLDSPAAHPSISVCSRGARHLGDWWTAQVLTPLALSQIFIPITPPDIPLPEEWSAPPQIAHPCLPYGPVLPLRVPSLVGQAHVAYRQGLGHFLIQPQVQGLRRYPDAEAVFAAWDQVIAFRRRTREQLEKGQQEDRRAFLRRLILAPEKR